jgi:hypothetical protein
MGLARFRAGWAREDGPGKAVEKSCQCEVGNEGRNSLKFNLKPPPSGSESGAAESRLAGGLSCRFSD